MSFIGFSGFPGHKNITTFFFFTQDESLIETWKPNPENCCSRVVTRINYKVSCVTLIRVIGNDKKKKREKKKLFLLENDLKIHVMYPLEHAVRTFDP